MSDTDTTYRLIVLGNPDMIGLTAATPDLAKLVPGDIPCHDRKERLGMERTEWIENYGRMKVNRSVVIEAENQPGEWAIGA
ncbi:MAG TPA: hypothetical protein VG328_03565 [Stellaceae bacterium]|nr:hypothetical protein [Stellaceae bacterium]